MGVIEIRTDTKPQRGEAFDEYTNRIIAIVTEFESLSDGHIRWFTHKNPYGCWICDLLQCFRTFVESAIEYNKVPEFVENATEPEVTHEQDQEE